MLIRSKIEREAGFSEITIEQTTYRFAPSPDKGIRAHVAYVNERAHINRLLGITEGFEVYLGEDDATELTQGLINTSALSTHVTETAPGPSAVVAAGDTAAQAQAQDPGPPAPEPVPGAAQAPAPVPPADSASAPDPATEPATADDLDQMTRDELAAIYEAEAGRKPNGRASAETIATAIREMREDVSETQ